MREGGATSYRKGWLKRRLPEIVLAKFVTTSGSSAGQDFRITVTGLSQNLLYEIGVAAVNSVEGQSFEPAINSVKTGNYPANPGTMQGPDPPRALPGAREGADRPPHAAGTALLDHAYQEVNVLERQLSDTFSPAEHAALCDLLDRATATLVDQTRRP